MLSTRSLLSTKCQDFFNSLGLDLDINSRYWSQIFSGLNMRTSWGELWMLSVGLAASLEECVRMYIYENINYPIISPAPIWKLCFGWLRSPQSESVRGRGKSFFSRTPLTFQLESRAPRNTRPARGISTLIHNILGAVSVISSDPPCKDGYVRFTTVTIESFV